nr:PREDICTED: uncharacterized protein LOC109035490 [Bemisia tabaci]
MIKLYHILEVFQSVDGLKQFQKGENSFESQHLCSLSYDSEIMLIKGSALASQRDKLYDVQAQEQPAERAMRRAQDVARRRRQLLRPPGLEFLNLLAGPELRS